MLVTVEGIVMDPRMLQYEKALTPIVSNEEPAANVTVCNLLQLANASMPIVFTVAGMVIDGNFMQLEKAPSSIVSSCEPSAITTDVRDRQRLKAYFPMLVTLAGMVIVDMEEPIKA